MLTNTSTSKTISGQEVGRIAPNCNLAGIQRGLGLIKRQMMRCSLGGFTIGLDSALFLIRRISISSQGLTNVRMLFGTFTWAVLSEALDGKLVRQD